MPMKFTFVDSKPDQTCADGGKRLPRLLCAIDLLKKAVDDGTVDVLTLSVRKRAYPLELPPVITYVVTNHDTNYTWDVVTDARFNVSHYIGSYSTKIGSETVTIDIKPRWGAAILGYLLQYTTGIYMPQDAASGTDIADASGEWLLVLLWKSMFNQALRRCHIPKEYRTIHTNDRFFNGRLDVQRQIHENVADQSKFCCVHAPLTMNTTINQTIRYIVRLLSRKPAFAVLMNDFASYDERLAAFGVEQREVTPSEIDRIRYNRMSSSYQQLMETSKAIIRRFGAGSSENLRDANSFFIDIAEIWENYIQAILMKYLPADYRVVSPNESGGEWLIANRKREIRPDILIKKANRVLAILDGKYKALKQIGQCAREGVSREDLYQMTTYLYHYGKSAAPLLGLFVSPSPNASDERPDFMTADPRHRIGVLGFDISQWDHTNDQRERITRPDIICDIHEKEKQFVKNVQQRLEEVQAHLS